jgi:hypothetical protein
MFAFVPIASVQKQVWVIVISGDKLGCGLAAFAHVSSNLTVRNVAVNNLDAPRFFLS